MIAKSGTLAAIVRVAMFGWCWWFSECSGLWGDDEFARYAQRSDRMTTTSVTSTAAAACTVQAIVVPAPTQHSRL